MEAPHLSQPESPDPVVGDPAPKPRPRQRFSSRHGAAMPVILILLTFLGFETRVLWREWEDLQRVWKRDTRSRVIGYAEVIPNHSLAKPPLDWLHDEGDQTFLWSAGTATKSNTSGSV